MNSCLLLFLQLMNEAMLGEGHSFLEEPIKALAN